jgi:hypothetical protein|tara:strand:- start:3188 stop:3436 length:249 start_codon:yes stop_codon:yes gene_type:complete
MNKEDEKYFEQWKNDLQSSVREVGDYVTQIIHFVGGEKRTFHNIDSESIRQGQFTKFRNKDGAWIMINDKNVLCIEVFKEKE